MTFSIQRDLPIKYVLGLHPAVPTYPNGQDFMFEVASHLVRVAEVKSKEWDPLEIKFSTKTLKYVFGENMNDESFRERVKSILVELLETGALIKKGEFIFIPAGEFSKYYLTA
jgi:hypothetical protein